MVAHGPLFSAIRLAVLASSSMTAVLTTNSSNLCSSKAKKTNVSEAFGSFRVANFEYRSIMAASRLVNVYSTRSVDLLPNVPNVWQYSTRYEWSATINLTNSNIHLKNLHLFLNTFTGWNNKIIYLCSPPLTPTLNYAGNLTYFPLENATGLVYEMLKILGKTMNFRPYLYEAPDKLWGGPMANSSVLNYTGCIGEIYNGKSLFGAAVFTPNADRKKGVDFSVLFMDESHCAALQYPQPETKIWHVFRPLHWNSWILLLVAVVVAAIHSFFTSYLSPVSAWNLELPFSIRDEVRLREHFWNVIGAFFMQGQDFYPYAMSARTVLGVWWLFTLIVFSAYSADLTSFLTVKSGLQTIKTLEELANRTDLQIVIPEATIAASVIEKSDYWIYKKLNSRKSYIQLIDECPKAILQTNATNLVCITDTSVVQYVVNRNCNKIYIIPQTFNTASMGFAVHSDSPYVDMLNLYIRKMMDNGLIEKWIHKYWSSQDPSVTMCKGGSGNSGSNNDDGAPIDLEGVTGVYICTGLLILLAFLVLVVEVTWVRVLGHDTSNFLCQD